MCSRKFCTVLAVLLISTITTAMAIFFMVQYDLYKIKIDKVEDLSKHITDRENWKIGLFFIPLIIALLAILLDYRFLLLLWIMLNYFIICTTLIVTCFLYVPFSLFNAQKLSQIQNYTREFTINHYCKPFDGKVNFDYIKDVADVIRFICNGENREEVQCLLILGITIMLMYLNTMVLQYFVRMKIKSRSCDSEDSSSSHSPEIVYNNLPNHNGELSTMRYDKTPTPSRRQQMNNNDLWV